MSSFTQDARILYKKNLEVEKKQLQEIGLRIKTVRGKQSQDVFAERLGISRGALSSYERGLNEPSSGTLAKICFNNNINISWLMFGTGPIHASLPVQNLGKQQYSEREGQDIPMLSEEPVHYTEYNKLSNNSYLGPIEKGPSLFLVPLVEAHLSAGGGSFEVSDQIERHYAFHYDFLRRKGNPEKMVLMRVTGDSMSPDIKDGDLVLIDQDQRQLRAGKVYAVGVEDMVYLKTVNAQPKQIILSSNNPLYSPIVLETGEHFENLVRIIGRAIWIGREIN